MSERSPRSARCHGAPAAAATPHGGARARARAARRSAPRSVCLVRPSSLPREMELSGLSSVVLTSVLAVAKVMFIASGGLMLARRGVLDRPTRKKLSEVTFRLTLPCFLFSQVATSVTAETAIKLYPLPLAATVYVALGALFGRLLAHAARAPRALRGVLMCACALGNSNNLPVVLMQAIVHMGSELLQPSGAGEGGDEGASLRTEAELEAAGTAYVGAYLSIFSFLLWSVGPVLLMSEDNDSASTVANEHRAKSMRAPDAREAGDGEADWGESDAGGLQRALTRKQSDMDLEMVGLAHARSEGGSQATESADVRFVIHEDEIEQLEEVHLLADGAGHEGSTASDTLALPGTPTPVQGRAPMVARSFARDCAKFVRRAITPPVVAVVLGVLVGTTPLHGLLVVKGAPLRVFFSAVSTLGQAAIPISVILLGANLSNGPDYTAVPLRLAAGVAISRMVLLPLCAIALVTATSRYTSILPDNDPMFKLVLLLEACCPTANNVVMMTSMAQRNEGSVSTTLFTSYVIAPLCLSVNISIFLLIIS